MSKSVLHNATEFSGRNIHCIGIGKAGADMIAVMLARAEIEDMLQDDRARFSSLTIDIGDHDVNAVKKEIKSMEMRLEDRHIPLDRVKNLVYTIKPPENDEEFEEFYGGLARLREYLKIEYPRNYWNPNYEPWIDPDDERPKAGDHISRGWAKGLYYDHYYRLGLGKIVEEFCNNVKDTKLPSAVYIFFGMAGGTGSGIAVDLARHVSMKLGRTIPVSGFAFMPYELDDPAHKGGATYVAMAEIDAEINKEANDGVMAIWGETSRNPWTGGMFAVPRTGAMWRLGNLANNDPSVDTHINKPRRDKQHIKVANHFVQVVLANFLMQDDGTEFLKATQHTGVTTSMYLEPNCNERSWQVISIFKWISPNVELLPSVSDKSVGVETRRVVGFCEKLTGLIRDFKTDYLAMYNYLPRTVNNAETAEVFEAAAKRLTFDDVGSYNIYNFDPPDEIVAYSVFIMAGAAKQEFECFYPSRDIYDEYTWEERFACHSYLVDIGVMLCEPSIRVVGNAGECIWGCACMIAYPYAKVRGDAPIVRDRTVIWDAAFGEMRKGTMKTAEPA